MSSNKKRATLPVGYLKANAAVSGKELIQHSFLSVKEVMALVGITDISHFVKDYKEPPRPNSDTNPNS